MLTSKVLHEHGSVRLVDIALRRELRLPRRDATIVQLRICKAQMVVELACARAPLKLEKLQRVLHDEVDAVHRGYLLPRDWRRRTRQNGGEGAESLGKDYGRHRGQRR